MKRGIIAVVILLSALLFPLVVSAQSVDSDGPIVRRKLLYRSTRFELVPQITFTLNDTFRRNILVGANAAFHLTNDWSLGGSFGFGLIHLNTDLAANVETAVDAEDRVNISYSEVSWAADVGVYYVPVFGKFSLLKSSSQNFDVHIGVGFSAVSETSVSAGDGDGDAELEGLRPGAFAALGFRLFLSDGISLNAAWKNRFYNRATIANAAGADSELSWAPELNVGVGFFFPGSVKISR